jgi:hypothetical protein
MKTEHLILGAGTILLAGMVSVALIPDALWEGEMVRPAAGVGMAMAPSLAMQAERTAQAGRGQPAGSPPGWSAPAARAQPVVMPGMTPFEVAPVKPFRGDVQQVIERGDPAQWGQVHILLNDVSGKVTEISLAPRWYLHYLGCSVTTDVRLRGSAFDFDGRAPNPVLYAKDVTLQGTKCRLRNDEGFALWSNQLRSAQR